MTLACPDCEAVFVRSEHLQRHRAGHMDLRPFSCGECTAAFSRKDVLLRHMQIHGPAEIPPSKHRRTTYVAQACLRCAKSKQRCDGQLPCGRCTSKSLECSYPASKGRRASQNTQSSVADQDQVVQNASTCQTLDNQSELGTQQFDNSSETGIATLPCWPPSDMVSITGLSSQPSLAPAQNLDSVLDVYGDFQGFGFSHMGLESYPALEDESPGLSWPSALQFSLPQVMIHDAAPTQNMPTPASSEPAVERLETEAPAPSFTQTFRSPHSSNEKSNDLASASARTEGIQQDSDAWRAEDYCHVPRLTEDVYQEMTKHFARYNRHDEYWSPFTSSNFPPITHMNTFIQVYFEEFHSLLPFLHKATFAPTKDQWILSLGVAAIGCIFSRVINSKIAPFDLQEFLRRAIHVQAERVRNSLPDISLIQAVLLNQLGMMFAPQMTFAEAVPSTMALLETLCRKMACYAHFDAFGRPLETIKSGHDSWTEWIKKESLRRLFYSVWILDCQYSCFWSGPGIVTIDCLQSAAPCHPTLWEASCQEAWQKHQSMPSYGSLPFRNVLLEFFRTQKVASSDPFNTLLLIIGVKYHAEKLNHAPIYLDILQDHAKTLPPSRLARSVGSLSHLLSMFLYLPVRELYAFSGWRVSSTQRAINHTKLRAWMRNKSEARASLTYACNAWSMIRRRKTGAQHEAVGFLLATLMIWAWIELGKRPDVEDVNVLLTVRLDEGKDHLKEWISDNVDRRLYLGGVGCLWDEGASKRLVHESANTLEGLDWPMAQMLASVLREHYRSFHQVASVSPTS